MRTMVYIAGLFVSINAIAENRVAVIDTGINVNNKNRPYLCKDGHEDFTGYGMSDKIGHGTEVVQLIIETAKSKNFCIVVLKFWEEEISTEQAISATVAAFEKVKRLGIRLVNYSASGNSKSPLEELFISTNPRIMFVVAAGNEGVDLDLNPRYPASYNYSNVIAVGALNRFGTRHRVSNYGERVKNWETANATSFATAIKTGKIIKTTFGQ